MTTPAADFTLPIDNSFDVDLADRLARLETYNKHHYRPNTYLHKWWARRCGTTFRLILKHLVTDPEQQGYYAPGGLRGKIILDPMMGGGTTLHEAVRLGANVIGMDLDPIPVLQARATLSDVPLADLEVAFTRLTDGLRQVLSGYYRTSCPTCARTVPTWYLLYGTRRRCNCREVVMVDSLLLRQERHGVQVRLCSHCGAVLSSEQNCNCPPADSPLLVAKHEQRCGRCGGEYVEDLTQPYYARLEPVAIVAHCDEHDLFFRTVDEPTRRALASANRRRPQLDLEAADFLLEAGVKSDQLRRKGIDSYLDLFSSRQLLYLSAAIELLPGFDQLLRLKLALLISTSLEFNSLLCGYKGRSFPRGGAVRHTFAHHAYAFPHTVLENNPLYTRRASGTLKQLFHSRIRNARRWAQQPRERNLAHDRPVFTAIPQEVDIGNEVDEAVDLQREQRQFLLLQGSAEQLMLPDQSVDAVVTDPPYYDSVQYSDLSAFFRVWLRRLLPADSARWTYDIATSTVDPQVQEDNGRYAQSLERIFGECHRVLRSEAGRLIFTYHHWHPSAWSALTIALKQAGFRLQNRYVVHAENPLSVHIAGMKALLHDAILVLVPRAGQPLRDWQRLSSIATADSYTFCSDCATLLGSLLDSDLDASEISAVWRQALDQ